MLGYARDAGHEITPVAPDADVIVVNTCAFIDNAKQESIDTILEMAQQKRDGKCSRLIVTGCLAERYRDELRKEIPEIDALLGTGELPDIVEAALNHASIRSPLAAIYNRSRYRPQVAAALQRLADALDGIEVGAAKVVPLKGPIIEPSATR